MKKIILSPMFFFLAMHICMAQDKETISYMNENGEPVKEKKARYLLQKRKINDTLWELSTYELYGPLVKTIHAKDENCLIKNGGYYAKISTGGDTVGYFANNQKDKDWVIRTSTDRILKKLEYANGALVAEKDSNQVKAEIAQKKIIDTTKKNIVFVKVEMESVFKGGQNAWASYLGQNLHYPNKAVKNRIQGTVVVQFIVSKEGKVEDVMVVKSVEYSLDQEALRIIRNSPDWIPAVQEGRKVKSYKKQPIVFSLQTQRS